MPVRPGPAVTPAVLRAVVAGVGLEVVLLLAGTAYLRAGLVTSEATEEPAAVGLVLFALAFAAGLAVCARALWQRRRWARSPVLVWQVLQLSVGVPQFGDATWAGLLLCLPAAAVLAGLFSRDVTSAVDR